MIEASKPEQPGRDGHWLYRALKVAGYDVCEIDPASGAVDRRRAGPSRMAWTSTSWCGCFRAL